MATDPALNWSLVLKLIFFAVFTCKVLNGYELTISLHRVVDRCSIWEAVSGLHSFIHQCTHFGYLAAETV